MSMVIKQSQAGNKFNPVRGINTGQKEENMKLNYRTTIKNMSKERLLKYLDRYENRMVSVAWDDDPTILRNFVYAKKILKEKFNIIY